MLCGCSPVDMPEADQLWFADCTLSAVVLAACRYRRLCSVLPLCSWPRLSSVSGNTTPNGREEARPVTGLEALAAAGRWRPQLHGSSAVEWHSDQLLVAMDWTKT